MCISIFSHVVGGKALTPMNKDVQSSFSIAGGCDIWVRLRTRMGTSYVDLIGRQGSRLEKFR